MSTKPFLKTFREWLEARRQARAAGRVQKLTRSSTPAARPLPSALEPLEMRIAPAMLINPMTVSYQDKDGDVVTVKATKAIFTQANLDTILKFDVTAAGIGTPQ